MANELTKVIDTITPELFEKYMQQILPNKSALIQSGVVATDERVSRNIAEGGTIVTMPYWNDIGGDDEVLGDGDKALSTGKITAAQELATVMYRGRGWSVNEMAAIMSGDDPLGALLNRIADYWVRREQQVLLSVLSGLFAKGGTLEKTHKHVVDGNISPQAVLDAKQLLGDAADKLTLIVMHSMTYTELQKQNVIEFITPSNSDIKIPTYLGYQVMVDDDITPNASGVYTTYLLSAGSFGRNVSAPSSMTTFETARDATRGTDSIFTRRAFVMHPRGISWENNAVSDLTPTNKDLENVKNWKRVYDVKYIGMVAIEHKVGGNVNAETVAAIEKAVEESIEKKSDAKDQ
jgi:hypothetical protein